MNLHIERTGGDGAPRAITLEEWRAVVERTEGLRMAQGDAVAVNPITQEPVVLPNRGGDAEVFRADCRDWMRQLFWTPDGTVRFVRPEMKEDPLIPLARRIAGELDARVCDEDGRAIG